MLFEGIRIMTLSFKFWVKELLRNGLRGVCQVPPSRNTTLGILRRYVYFNPDMPLSTHF